MNHKRIESHIDNKIFKKLSSNNMKLESVKSELLDNITRFSQRDSFINVSKYYLLSNWKSIPIKEKYTTYHVMYSIKRLKDVNWLIENKKRFPNLSDSKLFKLIQFKDQIK